MSPSRLPTAPQSASGNVGILGALGGVKVWWRALRTWARTPAPPDRASPPRLPTAPQSVSGNVGALGVLDRRVGGLRCRQRNPGAIPRRQVVNCPFRQLKYIGESLTQVRHPYRRRATRVLVTRTPRYPSPARLETDSACCTFKSAKIATFWYGSVGNLGALRGVKW